MNENLKLYAKISLKSAGIWLLFAGVGTLITLITFLVAFFGSVEFMGSGPGAAHGKGGLIVYVVEFAFADPGGFVLVFGAPFFLAAYFGLASRTAIKHGLCLVWKNKGVDYFDPIIRRLVQRVVPQKVNEQFNLVRLKIGLREANRADSTIHPIQKRLLNYAIKKVKLEELDHTKEEMTIEEIVSHKVLRFISETTEPSHGPFWLVLGLQFSMLIVSLAM